MHTVDSQPFVGTISPPQPNQQSPSRHLQFSPIAFEQNFNRAPFLIEHQLCDHPLFDLDRLLQLTKTLPEELIEYNAGNIPISQDATMTPRNGLSAEETIARIANCKSWLVLKHVQRDPAYAQLLQECLDEVRPYSEAIVPGMTHPQAFIFVTSPGSVTPYHIDPEHNFLLQIRGSKEVRLLDGTEPEILSQVELENFYSGRGRNLKLKPENESAGWTFQLTPGAGLHFPVTFPHWVRNGKDVSISFSITFRTPDLDRRSALFQMNADARARGKTPRPVGASPWMDNLRYAGFRIRRKLNALRPRKEHCQSDRKCGATSPDC